MEGGGADLLLPDVRSGPDGAAGLIVLSDRDRNADRARDDRPREDRPRDERPRDERSNDEGDDGIHRRESRRERYERRRQQRLQDQEQDLTQDSAQAGQIASTEPISAAAQTVAGLETITPEATPISPAQTSAPKPAPEAPAAQGDTSHLPAFLRNPTRPAAEDKAPEVAATPEAEADAPVKKPRAPRRKKAETVTTEEA
ncbi:MAG: hypothetical protein AAGC58_02385 [Asticcacaulis sp.]